MLANMIKDKNLPLWEILPHSHWNHSSESYKKEMPEATDEELVLVKSRGVWNPASNIKAKY